MGSAFSIISLITFNNNIEKQKDGELLEQQQQQNKYGNDFEIISLMDINDYERREKLKMNTLMIQEQRSKLRKSCIEDRDFRSMSKDPCESLLYNTDLRNALKHRRLRLRIQDVDDDWN